MIIDENEIKKSSDKQTLKMLYEQQKHTLDSFLERNAISREEYDKSLSILKEKMKL